MISCAAYPERAIRIWDLESGKCINSVTDIHNGGVFSLCLLNNDTLLSGGGYGSIKFTNLQIQKVPVFHPIKFNKYFYNDQTI